MSMKDALSRIYFDDLPVKLLGDESRPPLERIVRAGGKVPSQVDVLVLASPKDKKGHVLAPGEIIDRTVEPAKPIYLRSVLKAPPLGVAETPVDPVVLTAGQPAPEVAPVVPLASNVDPVISQLGVDPAEHLAARKAAAQVRRLDDQAKAEAEERQEEDREQESALQDEDDDLRQEQEDKEAEG
jgi:hypothetical protein